MNLEKIHLKNGVSVIIDSFCPYDIYIGITNKGFDYDYHNNMTGLSHLFEHSVFRHRGENPDILYNGCTCFNYMVFYNKGIGDIKYEDSCKNLIYKFYNKNGTDFLKTFDFKKIKDIRDELENEYYFRKSYDLDGISLFMLHYGKKYLGGRTFDLQNDNLVKKKLVELWNDIDPKDIMIILKKNKKEILNLLEKTFGAKKSMKNKKTKEIKEMKKLTKTLDGNSCILTKCENEFCMSIKIDNTKENLIGLFLLSTLGCRINCINDNFYITFIINKNPTEVINYFYNERYENIVNNLLYNNSRKVYIDDIFHFYKYMDITELLDQYLYDDDYIDRYKQYIIPVVKSLKKNILIYGNLIVNTPPDNILINKRDLNNDKIFVTEILLDIDGCPKDEKIKLKRKNLKIDSILYRKTALNSYNLNLKNNIYNYCYFILFCIYNNVDYIKITDNVKISGDRDDIKYMLKKIEKESIYNDFYYRQFSPSLYEILFQFYFFDTKFPYIEDILHLLKNDQIFTFDQKNYDPFIRKCIFTPGEVYYIRTEYDFIITIMDRSYEELYYYLLHNLKDLGLAYSMNMYKSDKYIMLFNLTVDPYTCQEEIDRYLTSCFDIYPTYVVSVKSKKYDFSSLLGSWNTI